MALIGGSKHSISLDAESSLLAEHMMKEDETFSKFIQRVIKSEANRLGIRVEIKVVTDDKTQEEA